MSWQENRKWGERAAQGMGVACVFAVLLAIWPGWSCLWALLTLDGTPAWVQAVGSIGTIAGGVWAVRHQLIEQRKDASARAAEEERKRIHRCYHFMQAPMIAAALISEKIVDAVAKDQPNWNHLQDSAELIAKTLEVISAADLPVPAAGLVLNALKVSASSLSLHCKELKGLSTVGLGDLEQVRHVAKELHKAAERGISWIVEELLAISTDAEKIAYEHAFAKFR